MSKNKTAVMMALEQCSAKQKHENIHISVGLEYAITILRELLPVEKQQIIDAWLDGFLVGFLSETHSAVDYYSETFTDD